MNKAALVSVDIEGAKDLREHLAEHFELDRENPDVVFCLGGDGTYLYAERKYPGVPKALVRQSKVCEKCGDETIHDFIRKINEENYRIDEHIKLRAEVEKDGSKEKRYCANDFVLRNILPQEALRFKVEKNGEAVNGELIGDGLVVSTPFGSTAYFHSITGESFSEGFGVAFNNLTDETEPLLCEEGDELRITITRRDAHFVSDNDPETLVLCPGDAVAIGVADEKAKIIRVDVEGWPETEEGRRHSA